MKTTLESAVRAAKKAIRDEARAEKAAQAIARAEAQGRPVFSLGDNVEVARKLLERIAGDTAYDEGGLYHYDKDEGLWRLVERSEASRIVMSFSSSPLVNGALLKVNSTKPAIEMAEDLAAIPGFFAEAPAGLAFENTFLELVGGRFVPRRPDPTHRVRVRYAFDYDPNAGCPQFLKFLEQILTPPADHEGPVPVNHEARREFAEEYRARLAFLQEYLGLSLLGKAPQYAGKALILLGEGANGKSTFLEIVKATFPTGTVTGVAPHRWLNEKHAALLVGRLLNIVGELPSRELHESAEYKSAVTGDADMLCRNPYERSFTFRAICGHIFAANQMLASGDGSHGFFRRNAVIPFERTFLEAEQDKELAQRIIETELGGVLNWLLEGAQRALTRGKICAAPRSSTKIVDDWQAKSDPVRYWVLRHCQGVLDPAHLSCDASYQRSVELLFGDYKQWAEGDGRRQISLSTFAERLTKVTKDLAQSDLQGRTKFFGPLERTFGDDEEPLEDAPWRSWKARPCTDVWLQQVARDGRRRVNGRRCVMLPRRSAAVVFLAASRR